MHIGDPDPQQLRFTSDFVRLVRLRTLLDILLLPLVLLALPFVLLLDLMALPFFTLARVKLGDKPANHKHRKGGSARRR